MPELMWLVIILAAGLPLLGAAAYLDVRRRRELEGDAPPARGDAAVDAHAPAYVTQSEIDAMPLPSAGTAAPKEHPGTRLDFGHAGRDFATDGDRAVLADARVVMVDGEVTAIRELLAILASATAASPVVVAATGFSDEVLSTLRANRRALTMHVLAATPSAKDLYALRALVGGEVVTVEDLKAGYTPVEVLGAVTTWTSDEKSTWVDPGNS